MSIYEKYPLHKINSLGLYLQKILRLKVAPSDKFLVKPYNSLIIKIFLQIFPW